MTQFRQRMDAFIEREGMSPTAFGIRVLKNPSFVFRVRAGRGISVRTMDRVNAYLEEHNG